MTHPIGPSARAGRAVGRRCALSALPLMAAAVFFPAQRAEAAELRGRVVAITDGDSFTMFTQRFGQLRIRLEEIDAPESDQPYGNSAAQVLAQLVLRQVVVAQVADIDRHDRIIAQVFVGRQNVNAEMVRRGAAWVFLRYSNNPTLLRLQREAQAARRGLWSLPQRQQIPPWEWRASRRSRG